MSEFTGRKYFTIHRNDVGLESHSSKYVHYLEQRLSIVDPLIARWHQEADGGKLDGVDLALMCDTDDYVLTYLSEGESEGACDGPS